MFFNSKTLNFYQSMKKYITIFSVAFVLLQLSACRKDEKNEAKSYPEENPLTSFYQKSGLDERIDNYPTGSGGEWGFKFRPTVKGKINAVTLKLPSDRTNVPVTIWDAESKEIIKSVTIPTLKSNIESKQTIEPIAISPEKNYIISYNAPSYYERFKANTSDIGYPVEVGNISILSAHWITFTTTAFPGQTVSAPYFYGDVSFVFQQTD